MKKNYVIAVGRGGIFNTGVYNVCCTESEIQTVAFAHYCYAKDNRLYGNCPIFCIYAEGEKFDIRSDKNVVLIDCM